MSQPPPPADEASELRAQQLHRILDDLDEGCHLLSSDWRYLYINEAGARHGRRPRSDVLGQRIMDVYPNIERTEIFQLLQRCKDEQAAQQGDLEYVYPDGSRNWFEVRCQPVRDGIFALTIDISERKQGETEQRLQAQQLESQRARLLAAQSVAHVGSWETDPTTLAVTWSDETHHIFGTTPSTFQPTHPGFLERVHPDDRAAVDAAFNRSLADGSTHSIEHRIVMPDGRVRFVVERWQAVGGEPAARARVIGTCQDITVQKQAETRIRHLNRVHAVLGEINHTIVRLDEPREMLAVACRIAVETGGFRMAWIGLFEEPAHHLEIAAHHGATPDTVAILEALIDAEPPAGCCYTRRALEAGEVAVCNDIAEDPAAESWRSAALERGYRAMAALPLRRGAAVIGTFNLYADEPGFFDVDEVRLLEGLALDVSFGLEVYRREQARRHAEQALQESETRFRQLAENIQEVFWITDPSKSTMLYVSPAYETIWGRTCGSLYQSPHTWLAAIHADDRERVAAALARQVRGDYDEVYRIIRPDGTTRWIHDRAFPVRDAGGTVFRIVGIAEDITAMRQLEEQFRQSQKLEAIGTLAGGIAHDFNNILGAILGNVDLALADVGSAHPARESLVEIQRAGHRARDLVQRILSFSRKEAHERRPVSLTAVVEEGARLLRATLPAGVDLVATSASDVPEVLADSSQIHQILLNLGTNAWHAIGDRPGRIEISLRATTLNGGGEHPAELPPGRYAVLEVSDDGQGMDAATLSRAFEPFFTTKPPGRGTGLGLSVVHGIVQNHGGAITARSQVGRGTTFVLYFPAIAAAAAAQRAEPPAPARGQGQHVLYLDDEAPLVLLAARTLERLGYRATGFSDPAEALRAFAAKPHDFDLVITDLNMPGTSGLTVAAEILRIRPGMPVVLASGYVTEALRQQAEEIGIRHVLYKPSTLEEFSRDLHRLLSEKRGGNDVASVAR